MYKVSVKLNQAAFAETEAKHSLIGQISDKISNIMAVLSFATRKIELKKLDEQVLTEFIPNASLK